MDLQAITGQLFIVNGQVQAGDAQTPGQTSVPGIFMQAAPSGAHRGRKRDFLFVHLTLTGPSEETAVLYQEIPAVISRSFYQTGGSNTAALRQSLIDANQHLLRYNLSSTRPSCQGAVSCAVLHNDQLYVVQAGEALALLGHNFGVERLPANMPEQITPLGRSAGLSLRYEHHRLQNGDMLLLADPRIANLPTEMLEPALVDTDIEDGLAALRDIVGQNSARLLLIEFATDAPENLPDVILPTAAASAASTSAASIATPASTAKSNKNTAAFPDPVRESAQPAVPAAARRSQPERPLTTTPAQSSTFPADVEYNTRKVTASAAFGLANFTDWLTDMLARLRPPREENEEPTNWAIPALLALAIPILVAIIVTGVYLQRGNAQRFAELKTGIGQQIGLAEGASLENVEQVRAYYQQALLLAAEAETLRPADAEVARLRQEALIGMDDLDSVTRLQSSALYEYAPETNLTRIVLQSGFDGGLYTLTSNSRVFYHQTDESYTEFSGEPTEIAFSGKALGSHIVGTIVDLIWRPQGTAVTQDGLGMLDASGALLTFYSARSNTSVAPLGLSSIWQIPTAIASFAERLYILDPGAREIWKYYPDGDGFIIKEGEQVLDLDASADLNAAIDMDLYSEDGSLLLLYGDGRLRYYDTRTGRLQWDETELLKTGGLTLPLTSPTTAKFVGRGLNASIFVADPGTGRIVQIARGGRVIAQYRANDEMGQDLFRTIHDFAVAEAPLRIFVTDGNRIYVATQK
ncbi:MAG: hypothetical protein R6X34_12945 [Chloroflexota bacterium]